MSSTRDAHCYHPQKMANDFKRGDAEPSWPLRVVLGLCVTALVVVGYQLKFDPASHSATTSTTTSIAPTTTTTATTSQSTTTTAPSIDDHATGRQHRAAPLARHQRRGVHPTRSGLSLQHRIADVDDHDVHFHPAVESFELVAQRARDGERSLHRARDR